MPSFRWRQWTYDLRTNLLARPGAFLVSMLALGVVLPFAEAEAWSTTGALSEGLAPEPATAQVLMGTVAGAVMSVVSVVYSILLVALSLASMQFSTRILAGFMRDVTSQTVLGLFVGTFAYCLAVLRSVRTDPPFVPGISVTVGLGLAFVSLAALVLFIHHIVRSIQANVLVDRIASEAEQVLDSVFPPGREEPAPPRPDPGPHRLLSTKSGYVQLIDEQGLIEAAAGAHLVLLRSNGAFVAAGVPLLASDRPIDGALLTRIDIGAERTMQDDVEFGFRQIVDIALKALSPAVNDPSTAATCVDHLGRLLVRAAPRRLGGRLRTHGGGSLYVPEPTFVDLLDLSMEQIRQYGRADMAACLRLTRVLSELAPLVVTAEDHNRVRFHADRIREGAAAAHPPDDRVELDQRHARVCSAPPPR